MNIVHRLLGSGFGWLGGASGRVSAPRDAAWTAVLATLALALGAAAGCGGGPAGGRPTDGGADVIEAGTDAPVRVTCPAAAAGEKRGLGACCTEAANCADGVCWNGFCTKTCSGLQAGECGAITAPSPLPAGTQMTCAPNKLGDSFSYCLPGSLAACVATAATPAATTCAAGESCALILAAEATTVDGAPAGACLTKLIAAPGAGVGAACDANDGPYACEDEGGYLGSGCFAGRCTRACATSSDCPGGLVCGPRPYSAKLGGIATFLLPPAPGLCQGVFCGQVHGQAGLAPGQPVQMGRDGACPSGQICVPTIAVGAAGDTQYLSCLAPRAGAVAFGMACSTTPGAANRCADDSLCVARSGMSFCSMSCASDVDCPTGSHCMDDYATALPNGSAALLGMCTPRGLIGMVSCASERDCPTTQACLPAGDRTLLRVCQAAVGTKSLGEACAAASECRSGQCYDRDLKLPNGSNRAFCGGRCARNSDCGTDQLCARAVSDNNGTPDNPLDDVATGLCTPLAIPQATRACAKDADCLAQVAVDEAGGDTCNVALGTCYSKSAVIGGPCTGRASCPLGAYCRLGDPFFPGGACLTTGCDPAATTGVDACPAGAVCRARGVDMPLFGCYEGCQAGGTCARAAERYQCGSIEPGQPSDICIGMGPT